MVFVIARKVNLLTFEDVRWQTDVKLKHNRLDMSSGWRP